MKRVILDPGHWGMCFGRYPFFGKRSPEIPPGIYEGWYNRDIAERVIGMSDDRVRFEATTLGPCKVRLKTRKQLINRMCRLTEIDCAISLHVNAKGNGKKWHDEARGFRVFYWSQKSRDLAERLHFWLGQSVPQMPVRKIARRPYKILRGVKCPVVLLEMGFMTSRPDLELLTDPNVQTAIAQAVKSSVLV